MKYYIVLYEHLLPTAVLTRSGEYIELANHHPADIENLRTFPSFSLAKEAIEEKEMIYKGEPINVFSNSDTFFERYLGIESYRITKPSHPFFTKEEVRKVIASGNDSYHNRLVVNQNGKVQLIHDHAVENGFPVLHLKTYVAGEGSVGETAAQDDSFIEEEYKRLLLAWALHLHSNGRMVPALDYYPELDIQQIKQKIETVLKEKYT